MLKTIVLRNRTREPCKYFTALVVCSPLSVVIDMSLSSSFQPIDEMAVTVTLVLNSSVFSHLAGDVDLNAHLKLP